MIKTIAFKQPHIQNGISFIISREYNLIIPQLDVSKCNIESFDIHTIPAWKTFVQTFDGDFTTAIQKLKKKKYPITENNKCMIKIPYNYTSCIWENSPDLYNCTGEQVLCYLEKTQYKLSELCIRVSPSHPLVDCNITPETFLNLSISNYARLSEIMIANGETNPMIWCAIACWWNYSTETATNTFLKRTINGPVETYTETDEIRKRETTTVNDVLENDDLWIKILNEYCCPKIYSRCNWFLMLHARININKSCKGMQWINENKENIVWDEDLLSDTPSYAFNECYTYYDNPFIANELGKRFI